MSMDRQEIHKTIHEFFIRLKKLNREIGTDPEAASIKSYRVQIKKMRAFLRLIAMEAKDPKRLGLPKKLREQFKSGGKLRDLGLLEKRIEGAKAGKPGIQYETGNLFEDVSRQSKKIEKKSLSLNDFENAENKLALHLPPRYTTITLKRFLNEKMAAIRAIIARGKFTDKELHEIRKILKDILYTLKLYRENLKMDLGFQFWNSEELKKVKLLEERLGAYNDNCNSLMFLSIRRIRNMSRNEKELLVALRQELLQEKRELRELILLSLRTIDFRKII